MNNLVFNTVSSQLRTLITNTSLTVAGEVSLTGTASVTITNTSLTVAGEVEISNTSLTVAGEVSLTGTASVTITNTSLTVAGEVEISNTSLTVAGEVSLTGTASVTITNTSLTVAGEVSVAGHAIAETNTTLNNATGTGVVFSDTDISEITTGSFFVYNNGTSAITVSLQISPAANADLYVNDVDNDDLPVAASEKTLIAISKYGRYARLLYDAGAGATFAAYYIGQM